MTLAGRAHTVILAGACLLAAGAGANNDGAASAPGGGGAASGDGIGADWPRSWFEPPQTASEVGLREFSESPYLAGRGLPPVADRLPDDPLVIEPYRSMGKYGGRARILLDDSWQFFNWEAALTVSADMRSFLPNLAESWAVSEDGRTITFRLRPGIRWSDGEPLTSDDFVFTFNHLWMDKEWAPVTSMIVLGGRIEKVDDLTFRYVFAAPNPSFVNHMAQYGNFMVDPEHYFRNFHPAYVDAVELKRRVEEAGFHSWNVWVDNLRMSRIEQSAEVPTLRAYRVASRTMAMMRFERNPYYHKVDPEGRQLPYIDAVDAEVVLDNAKLATAKAATGQLDFAAFSLRTQDIPLLKLGERGGLAKVHVWTRLHSSDVAIQPNYTHADKRLRALYWDKRFRHALSYAINRDEMNDIIYFGRGVPRQVTVHPTSVYYEPQFAFAHTAYDPDLARSLLDDIGLVDIDGDGLREYADGAPLTITLEYLDFETPKGITMELVREYWRAVGIDLRLKLVDRGLQSARAQAGEMEMTVWHADRVTDILFPVVPDWWVPRSTGWDRCMWNEWARFYQTGGRLGEEPPPIIRRLQGWADELRTTMDDARRTEVARNMLSTAADNLWVIGTVGLAPHPVVVSPRLKNVLPDGIWGWDNRWTLAYHPSTWYFDE